LEPRRSTIAADGEPLDVVGAAPYEPAPEDEEPPPVQAAATRASAARPATDHPRRTKRGVADGRCPADLVGRSQTLSWVEFIEYRRLRLRRRRTWLRTLAVGFSCAAAVFLDACTSRSSGTCRRTF
jgi:hypothetical protein